MFSKKCVPPINETDSSVKSALRAAIITAQDSDSESDDTATESPSASLLIQSPFYIPKRHRLEPVSHNHPPKPHVPQSRSNSNDSMLQKLVTLFAGRKFSTKAESNKKHTLSSPLPPSLALKQAKQTPDTTFEQTATPPLPPRLTLPQAIPGVCSPELQHLSLHPDYVEILPASHHVTTGYAEVADDVFTPEVIQHRFHVPKSAPLSKRRNNSADKLLDRYRDVWAQWHSKSCSPEKMLFARLRLDQKTGDMRSSNEEQAKEYNEKTDMSLGSYLW